MTELRTASHRPKFEFLHIAMLEMSSSRAKTVGWILLSGHPLFWLVWSQIFPQPYENLGLRILMTFAGLHLVLVREHETLRRKLFNSFVIWLNAPAFFAWMYVKNDFNTVWLVSLCASIFAAHGVFTLKQASIGVFLGLALGFGFAVVSLDHPITLSTYDKQIHAILVSFCWGIAAAMSATATQALDQQRSASLKTLGIVAHELRSPIAAINLLTNSIELSALKMADGKNLIDAIARMRDLTRKMNHHIDTQITNARQSLIPAGQDTIVASNIIGEAIANYPFRTASERNCVELIVDCDFEFIGSATPFHQAIDNLIKNAIYSLTVKDEQLIRGDLTFRISVNGKHGEITVSDRGVGIPQEIQARIFETFFSTTAGAGHGLGLALCRSVMTSMNGAILLNPSAEIGASFTLQIPIKKHLNAQPSVTIV